MLYSLRQDFTYAIRSFSKSPTLTVTIVVSIGLAIAANTTVFGIVNDLLIRDMPVRDPARLCVVGAVSTSLPAYLDFRDQTGQVFEGLAAHGLLPAAANISAGAGAERVWGLLVSGNYFSVTGVQPMLGRGILPSEDEVSGKDAVVVLGYGLWRRLGADASVVGKRVVLSGLPYTVVGVAPKGFYGTDRAGAAEFWAPLAMRTHLAKSIARMDRNRNCQWLEMTGRLRAGVSREQALAAVNVVHARMHAEHEKGRRFKPITIFRVGWFRLLPAMLNSLMAALGIVVAILLLIACANVANLLLARAASRQREIGIRLAIGAGRGRIVRQLLTESVLLASAGAALGFVLAVPGTAALSRVQPPLGIPTRFDFSPDLRVLAFTTALAVATGIVFGLAPALTGTRGSLTAAIRRSGWGGGARPGRLAGTLVVVQVALSVVLLVGAGLFLRSLHATASIDVGMKGEGALMMAIDPKGQGYPAEKARQFFHEFERRVEAIPGVQSMGYVDLPPLSLACNNGMFRNEDRAGEEPVLGDMFRVGGHYLAASGIELVAGRNFDPVRDEKAPVAIINQAMAERLFGGENPVGRRIRKDDDPAGRNVFEVIGVVRNAKSQTLTEDKVRGMYVPFTDYDKALTMFGVTVLVRTGGEPLRVLGPLRQEAAALDPDLPLFNVKRFDDHIRDAALLPRVSGALFGAFGFIGLVLAVVGLYGLVNYSVRARTREIGIRIALGARPASVGGSVLRQGLLLVGTGLALGLAVAFPLSRFTGGLLYGVVPTDPATFFGVPAVLLAASLGAILLPARRACRVEPMTALREE